MAVVSELNTVLKFLHHASSKQRRKQAYRNFEHFG